MVDEIPYICPMPASDAIPAPSPQAEQPFAAAPPESVSIRLACRQDIPLLFDMLHRLARGQVDEERFRISEEDLLRDGFGGDNGADGDCRFRALIAERQGIPVGMVMFHETYSTWSGSRGLFISDMFVEEDQRGAGVGHALVHQVAQEAASRGLTRLELNVIHANPARNFYDRMGFAHYDNLLNYRLSDAAFARLVNGEEQ